MRWAVACGAIFLNMACSLATDLIAGPMVGHVSDTHARIWMQLSTSDRISVSCIDVLTNQSMGTMTLLVEGPPPFVADVPISGLTPERDYRIEVAVDGKLLALPAPELVIRTTPVPGNTADFKVGFGSGLDPKMAAGSGIFREITAQRPRAFLFLGNIGYLPAKEEEYPESSRDAFRLICRNHQKIRLLPELQDLLRSSACYATWDDRDFGSHHSDRSFVFAVESMAAFERFWPNPGYGLAETPATFCAFPIADVDFFLLDDRMFREPKGPKGDSKGAALFGKLQLDWLKKELLASRGSFKIIAAGNQFLAPRVSDSESWSQCPAEREAFLAFLAEKKISGVIFLSGNRSLGELSRLETPQSYPLFDLTSSPLTAPLATQEERSVANPLRAGNPTGEANFGILDFSGPPNRRHVTLRLLSASGKVLLEQTIFADQLR